MTPGRAHTAARPPAWTLVYRLPAHVLIVAAGAALTVRHLAARAVASFWQTLASLLTVFMAANAGGLLVAGDVAYAGRTYDVIRLIPGGMRTYGVALGALVVCIVYGYGQAHAGRGQVLRVCLAGAAGWHMLWLMLILGTYATHGRVYSWHALTGNAFIAGVAIAVGHAVPPDRD